MKKTRKNIGITILGSASAVLCIVITAFKASPVLNVCDELRPWGELLLNISTSLCAALIHIVFFNRT